MRTIGKRRAMRAGTCVLLSLWNTRLQLAVRDGLRSQHARLRQWLHSQALKEKCLAVQ